MVKHPEPRRLGPDLIGLCVDPGDEPGYSVQNLSVVVVRPNFRFGAEPLECPLVLEIAPTLDQIQRRDWAVVIVEGQWGGRVHDKKKRVRVEGLLTLGYTAGAQGERALRLGSNPKAAHFRILPKNWRGPFRAENVKAEVMANRIRRALVPAELSLLGRWDAALKRQGDMLAAVGIGWGFSLAPELATRVRVK